MKDFISLAKERYSVRAFSDKKVEDEKLALLLEAAKVAPTACNYQPYKLYVAKTDKALATLASLTPCTFGAPLVFVVCYDETKSAHGLLAEGYDFGTTDATIVAAHIVLEAADLGLGSCFVGRFKEKDVKDALSLPENIRVRLLIPVGYPAENCVPNPRHTDYRPTNETVEII